MNLSPGNALRLPQAKGQRDAMPQKCRSHRAVDAVALGGCPLSRQDTSNNSPSNILNQQASRLARRFGLSLSYATVVASLHFGLEGSAMRALSATNVEHLLDAAEKAIAALRAAVVGARSSKPRLRAAAGPDPISPTEAAERFGVSAETIRRHCRRGEIGIQRGGRWLVSANDVRDLLGSGGAR
jgi:excisionase family DNA binding protein